MTVESIRWSVFFCVCLWLKKYNLKFIIENSD